MKIEINSRLSTKDVESRVSQNMCDAVLIATGTCNSWKGDFEGDDKTLLGLELLESINFGAIKSDEYSGKNVVIIDGGNVAMDTCRSAVRLEVYVVSINGTLAHRY